jgi:phosphotransacetylase
MTDWSDPEHEELARAAARSQQPTAALIITGEVSVLSSSTLASYSSDVSLEGDVT